VDAVFLGPLAYTTKFAILLVFSFLYAIGKGSMLASNAVYLHEIVPPQGRHKIAMRIQLLTVIVILIPTVMANYWIPAHNRWYIWGLVIILIALTPLGLALPESPRWLEARAGMMKPTRSSAAGKPGRRSTPGRPCPPPTRPATPSSRPSPCRPSWRRS
jgi:MFS family permease